MRQTLYSASSYNLYHSRTIREKATTRLTKTRGRGEEKQHPAPETDQTISKRPSAKDSLCDQKDYPVLKQRKCNQDSASSVCSKTKSEDKTSDEYDKSRILKT